MNEQVLAYVKSAVKRFRKYNPLVSDVHIADSNYLILRGFSDPYPNDVEVYVNLSEVQMRVGINMVFETPANKKYPADEVGDRLFLLHPVDQTLTCFSRLDCTKGKLIKWIDYFKSLSSEYQQEILNSLPDDNVNKVFIRSSN